MGGAVHREDEAGTPPVLVAPAVVVKGKRSKRQRVHAPPVVLTAPEWSSSAASAPGEEDSGSTSRSADEAASATGCVTEEEEDMALCLMLLSRGEPAAAKAVQDGEAAAAAVVKEARFRSRRPAAAGEFVYECKTCNKCFPSFQALGGHRTSHKKPRLQLPPSEADQNPPAAATVETATTSPPSMPPPSPAAQESTTADATVLAIPVAVVPKQEPVAIVAAAAATTSSSSKHPRVHECSICGAEFASGQALGGHMRRHRPLVPAAVAVVREDDGAPRKEKSLLELDLNMPAPCDEPDTATSPRFAFAERQPASALLFPAAAASALVDCHY